jgi:hypothetical protein
VSPSTRKALEALATLLLDYHYSGHAIGRIAAYAAANGTPTGCPYLDREDEEDANMVFEREQEPVSFDSECWGRDTSVIFDVPLLTEGRHPWPIVGGPDDDREHPTEADSSWWAAEGGGDCLYGYE